MNRRSLLTRAAWAVLLSFSFGVSPALAAGAPPTAAIPEASSQWSANLRESIFSKLDYDSLYFHKVLDLKARGKRDTSISAAEFDEEVKRATVLVPVLEKYAKEKQRYLAGAPFSLPTSQAYRIYNNLLALMNMLQAYDRADWAAVSALGPKVDVKSMEDLGRVRAESAKYYVGLRREYFYLLATANYRLGNDEEAVKWFTRLEADTDLVALKKSIASEQPRPDSAAKLELLKLKPIALVPCKNLDAAAKDVDWIGPGLAEVLTADLVQHTSLTFVERNQVDKVYGEVALSVKGVTDEKMATDLGRMLNADSLLVGSYRADGKQVLFNLRLLEAQSGAVLGAASKQITQADLFREARDVALGLLAEVGWISSEARAQISQARAPKADTVKDLMAARLMRSTHAEDAKALYAKIAREDPAYANLFEDLKQEFKDVSAAVAVLPFVNASGNKDDTWMAAGASEALSTDLPKLHFTVVERSRLKEVYLERLGQVMGTDEAREIGKQVAADFVVLGSLLRQDRKLRLDARFVEVRTGVAVVSVSAENDAGDFLAALTTLTKEIAARFNERLSKETLAQMVGQRTSKEDFEKYVREQLAKDSLAEAAGGPVAGLEKKAEKPSRTLLWTSVGGAVAGAALAATGLALAADNHSMSFYYDGLQEKTGSVADRNQRNAAAVRARNWGIAGYAGLGVAALSLGYIAYDAIRGKPAALEKAGVTPLATVGADGAVVGVAKSF